MQTPLVRPQGGGETKGAGGGGGGAGGERGGAQAGGVGGAAGAAAASPLTSAAVSALPALLLLLVPARLCCTHLPLGLGLLPNRCTLPGPPELQSQVLCQRTQVELGQVTSTHTKHPGRHVDFWGARKGGEWSGHSTSTPLLKRAVDRWINRGVLREAGLSVSERTFLTNTQSAGSSPPISPCPASSARTSFSSRSGCTRWVAAKWRWLAVKWRWVAVKWRWVAVKWRWVAVNRRHGPAGECKR